MISGQRSEGKCQRRVSLLFRALFSHESASEVQLKNEWLMTQQTKERNQTGFSHGLALPRDLVKPKTEQNNAEPEKRWKWDIKRTIRQKKNFSEIRLHEHVLSVSTPVATSRGHSVAMQWTWAGEGRLAVKPYRRCRMWGWWGCLEGWNCKTARVVEVATSMAQRPTVRIASRPAV